MTKAKIEQRLKEIPKFTGNTSLGLLASEKKGPMEKLGLKAGPGEDPLSKLGLIPGGIFGRKGPVHDELLRKGGGNEKTEAAVILGLEWIVRQQKKDGSWTLEGYDPGLGVPNNVAGTAFGLLPLLGTGATHQKGPHAKTISKGLSYLMVKQKPNGDFGAGMYTQGLTTIAFCEAFGLTGDPRLKKSAQAALNYLVWAQHPAGGWRYGPGQAGDTSVTGWQFMALKTGQMVGLDVPNNALLRVSNFLNSVQRPDGSYGYTSLGNGSLSCTAIGLLCRQYLGWRLPNPGLARGLESLVKNPPSFSMNDSYYYYYATQVMHHIGGDKWEDWNVKMRDRLIEKQERDSSNRNSLGSWSPIGDPHAASGGRLMVTSLSLLTLEVYYRYVSLSLADKAGGKDEKVKNK